ncbi:hypothetical protein DVZ84_31890 [Streptomyces parvulus]|uniref:Uncharacterized protein n=1 Tax=Streptomyces parvulus TaxID=146923 RepID=A0A369UX99_9ACTN|nr:hypothetical protein DVZ84_31890 [Streptomyces parvulus]
MDGTGPRRGEPSPEESRVHGTMRIWQWARWAALVLALSWAVSSVGGLVRGEGGRDLWWPLVSTVIWARVTVNGFVTYHRIRKTMPVTLTDRPAS